MKLNVSITYLHISGGTLSRCRYVIFVTSQPEAEDISWTIRRQNVTVCTNENHPSIFNSTYPNIDKITDRLYGQFCQQ